MKSMVYNGEVDIDYIFVKSKEPSDVLVVAFPGQQGVLTKGDNKLSFTYMLTIGEFKVNALYIGTSAKGYSKSQMRCINRDFVIERTLIALIEQCKKESGATRVIATGTSMGGTASIYYGLKYDYDIIAGSAAFLYKNKEYCEYAAGGTTPADFAWYNGLMTNAIKEAGERGYDKNVFLCWGQGEALWTDKSRGQAMLDALDAANIKYELQLMDFYSHGMISRFFPALLKGALGRFLGVEVAENDAEQPASSYEKAALALDYSARTSLRDDVLPITGDHEITAQNLPAITEFSRYFADLAALKDKLDIIIVSKNASVRRCHKDAVGGACKSLGIAFAAVPDKKPYLAVIERGAVTAENRSADKCASAKLSFGESTVLAESGYTSANTPFGRVYVNGTEQTVNSLGLNVVVLDAETGALIDSVAFDLSAGDIGCCRVKSVIDAVRDLDTDKLIFGVNVLRNLGETDKSALISTYCYAAQGYVLLPEGKEPLALPVLYSKEQQIPAGVARYDFWHTVTEQDSDYAFTFKHQAELLNYYKLTGDTGALQMVADELNQFFSKPYYTELKAQKAYISHFYSKVALLMDFACELSRCRDKIAFWEQDKLQSEIIDATVLFLKKLVVSPYEHLPMLFLQLKALLSLCVIAKRDNVFFDTVYNRVLRIAGALIDYHFDDNGVCVFAQGISHHTVMNLYKNNIIDFIEANGLPKPKEFARVKRKLGSVEKAAAFFVRPDKYTPNIGNSANIKVSTPPQTGSFIKPTSNIAILSDKRYYMTINGGSNVNASVRHCDLLSFTFRYKGKQLVYDAGKGAGDLREYAMSAVAHSALICDEADYTTPGYADWTAMDDTTETDRYVFVNTKHGLYEGVELIRKFFFIKPNIIVIYDTAESEEEHLYTQNFLFPDVGYYGGNKDNVVFSVSKGFDFSVRQFAADGSDFALRKFNGTDNPAAPEAEKRGSLCRTTKPAKLINLAYEKRAKNAAFLTAIEVHTGLDDEYTLETAEILGDVTQRVHLVAKSKKGEPFELDHTITNSVVLF